MSPDGSGEDTAEITLPRVVYETSFSASPNPSLDVKVSEPRSIREICVKFCRFLQKEHGAHWRAEFSDVMALISYRLKPVFTVAATKSPTAEYGIAAEYAFPGRDLGAILRGYEQELKDTFETPRS